MKIISKRKIKYPIGLERAYAKEIVAHTKRLFTVIRSFIPKMINILSTSIIAFDDTEDELSRLMREVAASVDSLPSMEDRVRKMFDLVYKRFSSEITSVFSSVFGSVPYVTAPPFRQDDDIQDMMKNAEQIEQLKRLWVQENLDLIKSIDAETLRKIRETMSDMIIGTVDRAELNRTLIEALKSMEGAEERRAALIGRDQVGKLNGRLSEYQQRQLGIEEYIWVTAGDERVRKSHRELNGRRFKWNDPPPEGHPGYPIQCRCIADPVIDIGKINLAPKAGSYEVLGGSDTYRQMMGYMNKRDVTPRMEELFQKFVTPENLIIDPTARKPMFYSPYLQKIIVNPQHKDIDAYNMAEAVTHELIHLIDEQGNLRKKLFGPLRKFMRGSKAYIFAHEVEFKKLLNTNVGKNMCVADIISSLTEGEIYGEFGHRPDYYENRENAKREVIANILTLLYTGNKQGLQALMSLPGMRGFVLEVWNAFSTVSGLDIQAYERGSGGVS